MQGATGGRQSSEGAGAQTTLPVKSNSIHREGDARLSLGHRPPPAEAAQERSLVKEFNLVFENFGIILRFTLSRRASSASAAEACALAWWGNEAKENPAWFVCLLLCSCVSSPAACC